MRRRVDGAAARAAPGATVAEIRDLLGTTRKYAVPLCEYLDRIGVTPRDGDLRVPRDSLSRSLVPRNPCRRRRSS